jgi:hypothetical protein
MNGFTVILFKPLIAVVGKQFDEKVKFIRFKIASRNPVHGKHALSFFDVISHGTSFVVKTPQIERFLLEVGGDWFVSKSVLKIRFRASGRHPPPVFGIMISTR